MELYTMLSPSSLLTVSQIGSISVSRSRLVDFFSTTSAPFAFCRMISPAFLDAAIATWRILSSSSSFDDKDDGESIPSWDDVVVVAETDTPMALVREPIPLVAVVVLKIPNEKVGCIKEYSHNRNEMNKVRGTLPFIETTIVARTAFGCDLRLVA
jgi:hypothetical protein